MITNGGEEFDIDNDDRILEINSPKSHVDGPYRVLHTDVQERWAVVVLKWDKKPRLGIRWFCDSYGTPNSRRYSTWFVVPSNLAIAVLNGLPLAHDTRELVEDFLNGKVNEDVFQKAEALDV